MTKDEAIIRAKAIRTAEPNISLYKIAKKLAAEGYNGATGKPVQKKAIERLLAGTSSIKAIAKASYDRVPPLPVVRREKEMKSSDQMVVILGTPAQIRTVIGGML